MSTLRLPFREGAVALVTGGSGGIGRGLVEALAGQGLRVAFTYRSGADTARAIEGSSGARAYPLDVRSTAEVRELARAVASDLGPVEYLVNNAGMTRDRLLPMMRDEDWEEVLEVNLSGVFRVSRAVATEMMKQRRGSIVNVTSVSALTGVPGQTHYAAAKAGVIGFTRALAQEAARRGVRVNALALGSIDTEMTAALKEDRRQQILGRIPLGRFGRVEEATGMALCLLSDLASYVTGQVFVVDGGLTG